MLKKLNYEHNYTSYDVQLLIVGVHLILKDNSRSSTIG